MVATGALARNAPISGRKLWTFAKLYAAVRDLPEIIPLIAITGATVGVAAYTTVREYGLAGDFFVSTELRKDMEKQIQYSERHEDIKPFVLWRVAQWRREDDGTIDVGVWPFHNKSWKYDHVSPHAKAVHMPADKSANQHGSPYPTEY